MVLSHAEHTEKPRNHAQEVRIYINELPVQHEVLPFCGHLWRSRSSERDRGSQGPTLINFVESDEDLTVGDGGANRQRVRWPCVSSRDLPRARDQVSHVRVMATTVETRDAVNKLA